MRKNKTQATRLLSKRQRDDLLVLPRVHADLLLSGMYDLQYLHTIAGMFNIAIALANLHRRESAELELNRIQDLMANLISEGRLPEGEERGQILAALDVSERLIGLETKQNIVKALAYIDRRIAEGRAQTPQQREADNASGKFRVMNF